MRGLHWFRNDLRLQDNTALSALVAQTAEWLPVFVLDPRLTTGPPAGEARIRFLLDCPGRLARDLARFEKKALVC
jgi:deoxyribodipyrimidine photolyase